jgi:hypothetical protein
MMPGYTKRFIIVVRENLAARAIAAASRSDTDPTGGSGAFVRLLSADGTPPAQARWCNWGLTPAVAGAIRARLIEEGATVAETTPVPLGGQPATNRFAVFAVDEGWTPDQVLAAIGMRPLPLAWETP